MKLYATILLVFLFISCSAKPPESNAADENKKARNKQTALKNEVTDITQTAQKLEQQGRGLEVYRQAGNPENMRQCNILMESGQKQAKDLEARIQNLPDSYKVQLTPIIPDLNECLSCSKNAKNSCINARASINKAIKDIYAQ